jgi:hypothetical protein
MRRSQNEQPDIKLFFAMQNVVDLRSLSDRRVPMITRRLFCSVSLMTVAATLATTGATVAQNYPTKPVRLLIPDAAGGGTDAIARLVAQGVSEKLGKAMVVENNGSAGGNLATQQAASARPDGYTVLMANQGPMVINPHLFKNVTVDPLTAFDPVTLITTVPLVFVVRQDSPIQNLHQLVEQGQGGEPIGNAPEEFAAMMNAESARWAGVIKEANITVK